MTENFVLIPRKEPKQIEEWNDRKNAAISAIFENSKHEPWFVTAENFAPVDEDRVFNCYETKKIPFGKNTTLGKAGCAVFASHQGLRLKRDTNISISELANKITVQDYYCDGKGTYHCLFDHLQCKRAVQVQELINYLSSNELPVATLLVNNSIYYGRGTGLHFVNAVGITNVGFIIDDSEFPIRQTINFDKIIEACDVAWLW